MAAHSRVSQHVTHGRPVQRKKNLDTGDHNPCRKKINAEKYCKSLDLVKSSSLSFSEVTQSHAATAEMSRTLVASSDGTTEVEMATASASKNAADHQPSNDQTWQVIQKAL